MDNEDIQENQVMTDNESERNPQLVSLEGHKSKERKSLAKERQESFSSLISKVHPKILKKSRRRESSTDNSSLREVSQEVMLYPAKKKIYGKRRRRSHTTASRDSFSSDGNDSDDLQHTRFKIVTEDEKFKWKANYGKLC